MPRAILLFVFGDLGDTLLTVPAMRALRRRYPAARIVLLGKPVAAELARQLELVDDAIEVDKHLFDRPTGLMRPAALFTLARLLLRLRRERFDTVVIFHHLVTSWGTLKYALLSLATGARRRVGLDNGRGWFLTDAAQDRGFGAEHEAQYLLEIAARLDAPGSPQLESPVSDADRAAARSLLDDLGIDEGELLIVHPGGGSFATGRRWPSSRFAAAASLVMAERPLVCLVVGTKDETELAADVADRVRGRAVNLAGRTRLGELAALLERASVVLANDAGVAHLAAAVGTPVVTIFGPSNDRAWRPLGGLVVAADLPCRPCFYRDFEHGLRNGCATRECLHLVTPGRVADAALALLQERPIAV